MNELPEGWKITKVKDVALDIQYGYTESSSKNEIGPKFLRITDIQDNQVDWETVPYCKISDEDKKKKKLEDGDLVFARTGATVGKSFLIKGNIPNAVFASYLIRLRFPKTISVQYIYNFFQSPFYWSQIVEGQVGIGQPNVNGTKLGMLEFPLPPLPVQHAIVTKIEEIFSELDHGVEQLKTARAQLKVYRQAVLNAAITDESKHTIESVIESLDQGWSPKCYNEPSINKDEWAVIKTTAVQAGYYQDAENKRLPENLEPRKQHELKKGDLLITRAGPRVRVGICCLVKKTRPRLLNCDKVYRMRINPTLANPEYVEMLLNSPKYSKEIEKMKTGISDSGVNLTQKGFLKILIPLPTLTEQHQIVSEIERRLSVCDKLEETIEAGLKQAEVLRAGVLKMAFEGRLVGS